MCTVGVGLFLFLLVALAIHIYPIFHCAALTKGIASICLAGGWDGSDERGRANEEAAHQG